MGVIGRLDQQVDDILIKPVRERQPGLDEESTPPAPESKPDEAREEATARHHEKARPSSDDLPVWLL